MIRRIEAPMHAGIRDQAVSLVNTLEDDLTSHDVVLDCSNVLVGSPSFLDEIVKLVLVERHARTLSAQDASDRVRHLLERSAKNRGLRDRLMSTVPS